MTPLHACILLRDFKSFQRLLNVNNGQHGRSAHPGLTSGHASKDGVNEDDHPVGFRDAEATVGWGSPPKHRYGDDTHGGSGISVNEKDAQGRTALHIACSSPNCVEYVRLLLKHPSINVNIPDVESHYTPLHRAMYVANLPAALSVAFFGSVTTSLIGFVPALSRISMDVFRNAVYFCFNDWISIRRLKITRGIPRLICTTRLSRERSLITMIWMGSCLCGEPTCTCYPTFRHWRRYSFPPFRNATLGFSDGNNRSHPDQIVIQPKEYASFPAPGPTRQDRFFPIRVRQVGMSKLHTVVVTAESGNNTGGGNLRICGFGSSGRSVLRPFSSCPS